MLQFFRNFFKSKVGIVITLAFLALIALAFASMDVANTSTFGGVTGGDRVAVVGDRRIDTAELSMNATNTLNQIRQQEPTLTMEAFVAQGGVDRVLDQMLSRAALAEFGREHGLRAGKRLVDSEIRQIPAFRDVSGSFSEDAYRAALLQQGLSDPAVREDLAMGLFARQLITPVSLAPTMPESLSRRYAQLLRENREGAIGLIPSAAFAPAGEPSAAQLQSYYEENRSRYIRPERRVIRYATFGEDVVADVPAPTQAQIAARYQRDQAQYARQEDRSFTQLVVPTEAAAQAIIGRVRGGQSLEAAAGEQGLATTQVGPVDRQELAEQTSAAVAQAGFAAERGALAAPARGDLGWYVLRVDEVTTRPGRSLAEAREEIAQALAAEQRAAALGDLTARLEEELEDGRSLAEVANELGLELRATPPVTAAGQVYGTNESLPPELAAVVETAFDMEEEEPQLAVLPEGEQYLIFEVADITASASAPLAEIRDDVAAAWRRDQGLAAARKASSRVMRGVAQGQTLAEAMRAEDVELPAPDQVDLSRQEISQQGQVPPVLALLFSMAEGTVKRLEAPAGTGWFVVALNDIVTPELEAEDPIVAATDRQLESVLAEEYLQQFIRAVETQVGIERNQVAIDAVVAQLTGRAN